MQYMVYYLTSSELILEHLHTIWASLEKQLQLTDFVALFFTIKHLQNLETNKQKIHHGKSQKKTQLIKNLMRKQENNKKKKSHEDAMEYGVCC